MPALVIFSDVAVSRFCVARVTNEPSKSSSYSDCGGTNLGEVLNHSMYIMLWLNRSSHCSFTWIKNFYNSCIKSRVIKNERKDSKKETKRNQQ